MQASLFRFTGDPMEGKLRRDQPKARTTDRATSHQAAASVKNVNEVQMELLRRLKKMGPMTDAMMWEWWRHSTYPVSQSGLRTRRHELEQKGYVKDAGRTSTLPSGRKATVWMITFEGIECLR